MRYHPSKNSVAALVDTLSGLDLRRSQFDRSYGVRIAQLEDRRDKRIAHVDIRRRRLIKRILKDLKTVGVSSITASSARAFVRTEKPRLKIILPDLALRTSKDLGLTLSIPEQTIIDRAAVDRHYHKTMIPLSGFAEVPATQSLQLRIKRKSRSKNRHS